MKKIVVIGGGTGNFVVLRGLKKYSVDLTAVVSMADDGGSTGILRDELGVLPPGDVRQCLVALSNSSRLMRDLMNYRFESGGLEGHSFGNLFLSALEKVSGSFEGAVEEVGKILSIHGKVLPVTTHQVRLKMSLKDGTILEGEKNIYLSDKIIQGYKEIFLDPKPAVVNPHVIHAILNADLIVMGPGGLYTSMIPNLLVDGIVDAILQSKAKKVYIVNLMNRKGQTTHFKVSDYLKELKKYFRVDPFNYLVFNVQKPVPEVLAAYAKEGDLVENDLSDQRVVSCSLLGEIVSRQKNDLMERNLIRHHSEKLATELMKIVHHL